MTCEKQPTNKSAHAHNGAKLFCCKILVLLPSSIMAARFPELSESDLNCLSEQRTPVITPKKHKTNSVIE